MISHLNIIGITWMYTLYGPTTTVFYSPRKNNTSICFLFSDLQQTMVHSVHFFMDRSSPISYLEYLWTNFNISRKCLSMERYSNSNDAKFGHYFVYYCRVSILQVIRKKRATFCNTLGCIFDSHKQHIKGIVN